MAGRYKTIVNQLEIILDEFLLGGHIEDIPGIVEFILNDTSRFHGKLERIQTILDEEELDDEV